MTIPFVCRMRPPPEQVDVRRALLEAGVLRPLQLAHDLAARAQLGQQRELGEALDRPAAEALLGADVPGREDLDLGGEDGRVREREPGRALVDELPAIRDPRVLVEVVGRDDRPRAGRVEHARALALLVTLERLVDLAVVRPALDHLVPDLQLVVREGCRDARIRRVEGGERRACLLRSLASLAGVALDQAGGRAIAGRALQALEQRSGALPARLGNRVGFGLTVSLEPARPRGHLRCRRSPWSRSLRLRTHRSPVPGTCTIGV